MKKLTGISASPGIAIGKVYFHSHNTPAVPRYVIDSDKIDQELERFHRAVEATEQELLAIRDSNDEGVDESHRAILDSHVLMVKDVEIHEQVESGIRRTHHNAEWVMYETIQQLLARLRNSEDDALRERSSDLYDAGGRVLSNLLAWERKSLSELDAEVIVVGPDLLPSDAIAMNKRMVKGIAIDAGGRTSHSAILARSFDIPSVFGLARISRYVEQDEVIIVDGNHGVVILHPDPETLEHYRALSQEWQKHAVQLMQLHDLPAETKDGKVIQLKANIEVPEEVEGVQTHGADGIGLYRSEFLFMTSDVLPDEEKQYRAYRSVLEALPGQPVTIRTLDIGGDKMAPQLPDVPESNPILGWRAIRYCLSNTDLFRTQLRALLRSSVHGKLRIMFPMISGLEELQEAQELLDQVGKELADEGYEIASDVPVGIMVEVPSAAMVTDILAKRSHFFSVGTNDLIQYTIAVDRGNQRIAYLYEPFHPGVLRLLRIIVENGHAHGIPVAMCGEMAGDPIATVLLIGLGFDELSMSSGSIPEVKRIIRSLSVREAEEVVAEAMEMKSFKEVDRFLRHLVGERFGVTTA
ncbi:MAG: phosphoenolpyruvate--protein phosphotransferase [Spirochaetota bacterium]